MADSQVLGVDACAFGNCTTCDFLPFKCITCDKKFCGSHRIDHDCLEPSDSALNVGSASSSSSEELPRVNCGQKDCNKPALVSFSGNEQINPPCERCRAHFCVVHRDYVEHDCKPILGVASIHETRNQEARALLLKNFAVPSPRVSEPRKPIVRKQSKTVQMMKLRQIAKAGENGLGLQTVPQQERIYILAAEHDCDYVPFWFRKSISTGKAFDLLQSHLKLASYKTWELFQEGDDGNRVQIIRFDQSLSESCGEGTFKLRFLQKDSALLP